MTYVRSILMGDPTYFRIKHGANPHTRNRWGVRKAVDHVKAKEQWQTMKEALESYGVQVHVIPAHEDLPGLVFPANAGYVPRFDEPLPIAGRDFVLSSLNPGRREEQVIYEAVLAPLGLKLHRISRQFEGQADLIPWCGSFLFTFGRIERQRFIPSWSWPPWRRIYGFRTDERAVFELKAWIPPERILHLELADERFYHGDTVFCSFGHHREHLLVYPAGVTAESLAQLENKEGILWLSEQDARAFAANSFQVVQDKHCILFMPAGISSDLRRQIEAKGVEVVLIDVSEFLEKGGGSVKCMVGDLGMLS